MNAHTLDMHVFDLDWTDPKSAGIKPLRHHDDFTIRNYAKPKRAPFIGPKAPPKAGPKPKAAPKGGPKAKGAPKAAPEAAPKGGPKA